MDLAGDLLLLMPLTSRILPLLMPLLLLLERAGDRVLLQMLQLQELLLSELRNFHQGSHLCRPELDTIGQEFLQQPRISGSSPEPPASATFLDFSWKVAALRF